MINLRRAADPTDHRETQLSTISVFGLYTVSTRTVVGDMGQPLHFSPSESMHVCEVEDAVSPPVGAVVDDDSIPRPATA